MPFATPTLKFSYMQSIGATGGGGPKGPFDKLLISTLLKRGEVNCEVIQGVCVKFSKFNHRFNGSNGLRI